MNDIRILPDAEYGANFIPPEYLAPDGDQYRLRKLRARKRPEDYRKLRPFEVEALVKNGNTCPDWGQFLVIDPFNPDLVRSNDFGGLVRLGRLERLVLAHHGLKTVTGISDSRIVDCDLGDNCAVHDNAYVANYLVGDGCILLANGEISMTSHAKFGCGCLKDGEGEDARLWLDVMNEAGGRSILAFEDMRCADAYLWARFRDDPAFLARLVEMTDAACDPARGYYGEIGDACVLKNNRVIKNVRIGDCAYVKGANKLKNLTIRSSDAERSQIGEGVELVNGIIGRGCRAFYGCKAVRFVMCDNTQLKYGARLIHSVLGDNSTVSCCELLNNLVFPAHEQHHNTSFLIASLVRGQSNMAAGATIGSNHNSRANDGEVQAGRGFWPGLCVSIKHSSRFASYVLLAKGDYERELDVPFPFSLVSLDHRETRVLVMPAYWWMYDMYALARAESKFRSRDGRATKSQHVEFSPFAPDTAEEIFSALRLLEIRWAEAWMRSRGEDPSDMGDDDLALLGNGLLARSDGSDDDIAVECPGIENSRRPALILKARKAWKAYRRMIRFYAMPELLEWFESRPEADDRDAAEIFTGKRERDWENLGGQIVPAMAVYELIDRVKSRSIPDWDAVHAEYDRLQAEYPAYKARHAYRSLCDLVDKPSLERADWLKELERFAEITLFVADQTLASRKKDWDNPFRRATFRNDDEMRAVLGSPETSKAVKETRHRMEELRARASALALRLSGR